MDMKPRLAILRSKLEHCKQRGKAGRIFDSILSHFILYNTDINNSGYYLAQRFAIAMPHVLSEFQVV
jgi:hypothetical protein